MFEPSVKVSVPTCSSAAQHVKMIADTAVTAKRLGRTRASIILDTRMRPRVVRGIAPSGGSHPTLWPSPLPASVVRALAVVGAPLGSGEVNYEARASPIRAEPETFVPEERMQVEAEPRRPLTVCVGGGCALSGSDYYGTV